MSAFRIGDTVTTSSTREPTWDGTVVDLVGDPKDDPRLVRVYWRYPLGKLGDCYATELTRVV